MKNKQGNVAVIALIVVIVAITASVITWLVATRTQAPVQQVVAQPTAPVAQTQPVVQSTTLTTQPVAQTAPIEISSDKSFDIIAHAGQIYNPMDEKYEKADLAISQKMKDFYDALKVGDLNTAIELMQKDEYYLLPYIFPIGSAFHKPLAFKAGHGGITMFIVSGNGFPSVPNDSYSFGHIWVSGNKILLRENIIKNYFDGDLGAEYDKKMNATSSDIDGAIKIMNQIEADTKKGFEAGVFANTSVQADYNYFISTLK